MRISNTLLLIILTGLSLLTNPVAVHRTAQTQPTPPTSGSNPDPILFLLSAFPTTLSIVQGYSGWTTIDVTTLPGQSGSVNLAMKAAPGLTATLNTTTVSLPPLTATAILSVAVDRGTVPGVYSVIVNGTSGGSSHALGVSVTVLPTASPSFSLVAGPSSLSISPGDNGTSIVTATSLNGFAGDVKLSATVSPTGPTTDVVPADALVPSNGTAYSTMKIITTPTTPSGNYAIMVQGSNGTLFDTWTLQLFVAAKPSDFSLTAGPTSLTIPQGTSRNATVTVSGLNGFAGDVRLSATVTPEGPITSLPADMTVAPTGQPATSTLQIFAPPSTPPGSYLVKINATSGQISHYTSLILTIVPGASPTFSISANPESIVLPAGVAGSSVVTLTSLNGFSDNVSLSLQVVIPNTNAPAVSFSPTTIALSRGQTASSTLTVTPTASTASGGYNVLLQASSNTVSDTWTVQVFVGTPQTDFNATTSPSLVTVLPGDSTTSRIALTSINGLSGTVSLSQCLSCVSPVVPERPMMTFGPGQVTLGSNGQANATLTFSTNSTTPVGSYDLVVTARKGTVLHFLSLILIVESRPDFSLATSSSDISFSSGSAGSDGILVTALNGFIGTVSFNESSTPATGLVASCTNVTLTTSTITGTSACSFNSFTQGAYLLMVTGSGEQHSSSHRAMIFVTVNLQKNSPTITATLSAVSITAGGSVTDSATLTGATSSAGGTVTYQFFTGSMCTGAATIVGSPVTVTNGKIPASASQTFSSPGSFSWNAAYTGDPTNIGATSQCETLTVTPVTQADFTVSVDPASLTIAKDHKSTAQITLQSISFTGRVRLHVTISPSTREGLRVHLENRILQLSSNSTDHTILTITTGDDTPPGIYNITITASSGPISHSVQLTITVVGSHLDNGCNDLNESR
jgi:uncharacterized membrane protein